MPKGSPELTNARREEIISACRTLYRDLSFKEITIMKIADYTSFTRTSIYNYFETKEEIFYDMEENSREERLCAFKVAYGSSLRAVDRLLQKFCTETDDAARQRFLYAFFPFIYGIYPYAIVTEKQKRAMEQANVGYVCHSIYDLAFACAQKLLT